MSYNNAKSNPFIATTKEQADLPKSLIAHDSADEFIPIFEFEDTQMAFDYAQCVSKCEKHNLYWQRDRFVREAKALLAVKGKRAALFGQTISRMPEISIGSKNKNSAGPSQGAAPNPNV